MRPHHLVLCVIIAGCHARLPENSVTLEERHEIERVIAERVTRAREEYPPVPGDDPYPRLSYVGGAAGVSVHNANPAKMFHESDVRFAARLPKPGESSTWSRLRPAGRHYLVKSLADIFRRAQYHNRGASIPTRAGAFSPTAVLSQVSAGGRSGECRFAAVAFALLLGELGAPAGDVRLVGADTHIWTEYRTSASAPWTEIDATPANGRPVTGHSNFLATRKSPHFIVDDILRPLDVEHGIFSSAGWYREHGINTGVASQSMRLLDPSFRERVALAPRGGYNVWLVFHALDAQVLLAASEAGELLARTNILHVKFPRELLIDFDRVGFAIDLVRSGRFPSAETVIFENVPFTSESLATLRALPAMKKVRDLRVD